MLEGELLRPEAEHNQSQVRSTYSLLRRDLDDYPDLEALLGAMRTFVSYL